MTRTKGGYDIQPILELAIDITVKRKEEEKRPPFKVSDRILNLSNHMGCQVNSLSGRNSKMLMGRSF